MREIIFRGKRKDDGEWVEGSLINAFEYTCILQAEDKLHPMYYPYLDGDLGTFDGKATPIIPETVGQYTGLTDKNGKKIFEGDIVVCSYAGFDFDGYLDDEFTAAVEFGNPNGAYNWGFQLRPIKKTNLNTDILLWVEMEETGAFIEGVGNIHDNPELTEGTK